MKKTRYTIPVFLIIALFIITQYGCAFDSKPIQKHSIALDTTISITLYDGNEDIIDDCFDLIREYESILSAHDTESELYMLNMSGGGIVSDILYDAISEALRLCELTNGAFDITLGRVSELWDYTKAQIPTETQIDSALKTTGYEYLKLHDGNRIEYLKEGLFIDLGGFAKGYIGDALAEYIASQNVESGLIALGGNITCIGSKPDNSPFNIAIENPLTQRYDTAKTLSVSSQSVATSGSSERYFIKDGITYHHIIDPETGYPSDSHISSVTIIADSAAFADALSTACFVLGKDGGLKLVEELGVKCVFIDNDGVITDIGI